MVSFFGLKLGSDKKKAQSKEAQDKTPQKWDRIDQNTLGEGQYFGHNFSRPHFPSSTTRPGTSNSTRSTSNWRAVFKNPAMTSSMVDLAPPQRRPSVGSLRHVASDLNMRPGTALPTALGGSGLRPGTPSRPLGAQKSEWVNPLDVHFCKEPIRTASPGTPLGSHAVALAPAPPRAAVAPPASPKKAPGHSHTSPSAGEEEADKNAEAIIPHTTARYRRSDEEPATQYGYPSPPQSDGNSERAFSPANVPAPENRSPNSKRAAPSALRKVDAREPMPLPSPAPSVKGASEDRSDGPVIRNLPARRDTFAFHQPLRQSFAMEFDDSHGQRATMMRSPKEGFSGNFADFDFGATVTKTASNTSTKEDEASLEAVTRPSMSSGTTVDSIHEALSTTTSTSNPSLPFRQAERELTKSPAPTQASEDQAANSTLIDQLPKPPRDPAPRSLGPPPAATGAHQGLSAGPRISPRQGFQSRFDAERSSRAPPPRPLRAVPAADGGETAAVTPSPYGPPLDSASSYVRDAPPPRPAARLPSSPFSRPPMAGAFPKTKGLPRGRRPEPPAPLQLAPPDDEDMWSLPSWSDFDRAEPRRSAMPAPLTPFRTGASQGTSSGISTPTSATAPRIPSPTFPSLAQSISVSSPTFGGSFDLSFDDTAHSPTLGGFPSIDRHPSGGKGANSMRVEARKAPPRPAPVTLPPSPNKDGSGGIKSPVLTEFTGVFI